MGNAATLGKGRARGQLVLGIALIENLADALKPAWRLTCQSAKALYLPTARG